jgi:hypothetical protein
MMTELFNNEKEIKTWLDNMKIKNYTINSDLTVDVNNDVNLVNKGLTTIPIQFGIINGYFDCACNQLTSLKGTPYEVKSWFSVRANKLKTLEGCPKVVHSHFYVSSNALTYLDFLPEKISGAINCTDNPLVKIDYEDLKNVEMSTDTTPFSLHLPYKFKNKLKKQGINLVAYEDRILKDFAINFNELKAILLVHYENKQLNKLTANPSSIKTKLKI